MKEFLMTNEEIAQIIEQRNTIKGENDYVLHVDENYAEIILRDVKGKEKSRTKISLHRVDELKHINWYASGSNYVSSHIGGGNVVMLHRFLLKAEPYELVDHINHEKFDNRDENIRICTRSENMMNAINPSHNTSGFKGVSKNNRNGLWRAYITINKKQINLGSNFATKEKAIEARIKANEKYQGVFAYPNAKGVISAHE